jgi:hypothetical protein
MKKKSKPTDITEHTSATTTQVKQSFQSDSDPDYVGFRRNPTTHSRDPTEIIWIRWDPTGYKRPGILVKKKV